MSGRCVVLKALDTPMTEQEVAKATKLHIVGVLFYIKELLAAKQIANIGIRKNKRMPHSNIFESLAAARVRRERHSPEQVDKLITEALTEHGPMVRSEIMRVTDMTVDRFVRGVQRLQDKKVIQQDGRRRNAAVWRLYQKPIAVGPVEFKTQFIGGKNPWQ